MSDDADPADVHAGDSAAWQPPSLETMQDLLPQYEFISLIGRGGMGAVYKATQISLDRPVAVKVLPPGADNGELGFTERFRIEARMMAKMSHPGIVSVHDFGIAGGHLLFFVMEFVDGTDVAKMILAQGRLEPNHALALTAHVCDALAYAHGRQVVHGDIKPANVLIGMDGQVKVADFGLARFNDASQGGGDAGSSVTLGTPDYAAPEIMTEGAAVDGRADLYAVGVMLYNMLTGEVPRGVFQPASAKTGCDPRLDAIVHKAMEQEPARRYQTAFEIRHDLDRIFAVPVAKTEPAAEPQAAVEHKPEVVRETPARLAMHGILGWTLAVMAALAVMGYMMWKDHGAPPKVVVVTRPEPVKAADVSPRPTPAPEPPPRDEPRPEANAPRPAPDGPRPEPGRPAPGPGSVRPPPPPMMGGDRPEPMPRQEPAPEPPKPQPVETEATRHLAELDAQFQAALDRDVTKVRAAAMAALDAKYLAALERSVAAAGKSANPAEVRALQAEKQRVETHQPVPDDDPAGLPGSVKTLLDTYRAEVGKIEVATQPTEISLHGKYAQVLDAYHDELVKAGKEDEAEQVVEKQKQATAARVQAMAGGPSHDIEYITEAVKKEPGSTAEGIVLEGDKKFVTKESFAPPVEIIAVAKTEKTNLRFAYAADQLIFNWEVREKSLRIDGGPAAGLHKEGAGQIPAKTFVTVRWLVTANSQTVFVDGEKRFEHFGNYSGIDKPVSVFTMGSKVTLKSLKVRPLRLSKAVKLANVEVEGTSLMPLRPEIKLYGDNRDLAWKDIPPLFGNHLFFQAEKTQAPTLKLKVLTDGLVYMACTSRWGGGGAAGPWSAGLITPAQLEEQGWRAVTAARELKSTEEDHTWLAFSRQCKAGETFRYQTEKYLSPIVIVDASAVSSLNGLPENGGAITTDRVLQPIEYNGRRDITIGRHDEKDPKKLHAVTVTSVPVTRIADSTIAVEKGTWKADGTRFIRTRLDLYLDGMMDAKNCIFEACDMGKKGTWFIPWYSTKWSLENCIVTKSFVRGWRQTDSGVQARRCTFYGVKFTRVKYREDAAQEVKKNWLMIKNCKFVECEIPESLLIATQDCVFEQCTFGESEPDIPLKSPLAVRIYVTEPGVRPATGPNVNVEVVDAAKIPAPAGTTLRHNRRQNIVDFSGPPRR